MAKPGSVLISGASIAGPTLAYWLQRHGFEPTLVERADAQRPGGQNIDIRGAGRAVVGRMGLEGRIRELNTGEVGTCFVDATGRTIAAFPVRQGGSDGPTAELEILRGELARLLVQTAEPGSELVYGDHIVALDEVTDGVEVTFARAGKRRFDLVVVAEGMRSRTRGLVFQREPRIRELGLYIAYFTIPSEPDDTAWWRWYNAPGGRSITLRPDNQGTTRATLSFLSPPKGYEDLESEQQREVLHARFADAGWVAPRVLGALAGVTDLYLEHAGQVLAPSWSRGRVALVGDAAYCASPISGMGTTLALTGAYVLAGELAQSSMHREAFARYERIMRPFVKRAQSLPPGAPRIANPTSRIGIGVLRAALRLAGSRPVKALAGGLFNPPANTLRLPEYANPGLVGEP